MSEIDSNWTVVTGSTGGIGSELVKILAARGDHLILINRSLDKAEHQRAELLSSHPAMRIELFTADFMDKKQIENAINQVVLLPGRIDVLYNNAGVLNSKKILSAQGFESHFAVNVLASYQMIRGLTKKMARPSSETPGMIVNFSSSAIKQQKMLDLNSLANPDEVTGLMGTYAQSKLAVTAMSAALADLLASNNILIRAVDPGATKTAMTSGNAAMPKPLQWLAPILFSPADKQAGKVIDSADPATFEGCSGILLANRKEKTLPESIADFKIQKALLVFLDHCLTSNSN